MSRRPLLALAFVSLAFGPALAATQDATAPDGSRIRQSDLERACKPALERFCPALSATPGQTRNQVICLKPYRSSLSQGCRTAVNAALK